MKGRRNPLGVIVCAAGAVILLALLLPRSVWWALLAGVLIAGGVLLFRCRS